MNKLVKQLTRTHSRDEVVQRAMSERVGLQNEGVSLRKRLLAFVKSKRGKIEYVDSAILQETVKVAEDGSFTIFLPTDSSEERDNFTVAHELGHYFLHRREVPQGNAVSFTRRGSNRMEWEANWFAAEFLMPDLQVRSEFNQGKKTPREIAMKFGVSQMAAKVRLESLGLLSS